MLTIDREMAKSIGDVKQIDSKNLYVGFVETKIKGRIEVWFSYNTLIAFVYRGQVYISENKHSRTTGQHIGYIGRELGVPYGQKDRLDRDDFENKFIEVMYGEKVEKVQA